MNGWQRSIEQLMVGVTRLRSLHAFFCACLFLLPLYAVPETDAPQSEPSRSGMGAPPPPLLDSLPRFGVWSGLERRLLESPPQRYRLNIGSRTQTRLILAEYPVPDTQRPKLALLGQWRLEGG